MAGTNKKIYDEDVESAKVKLNGATEALDAMNYDSFKQGSMYGGLKKSYEQQGQQAMKDTLGQVAARTGGMASSYATTAAQQSYNNYMSQLEDVARSMYNDEYSRARDKVTLAQSDYDRAYGEYRDKVSDDRYNTEWQYQLDRDQISDDRYNTDKEEERVASDAYYGNALSYADYKANGGILDEQTYNSIVLAAQGKYKDDNKSNRDTEIKALLGSEDFDWDNHDWNGDAPGLGTPEDLLGDSSYGVDYWKAYAKDAAQGYKDATTKDNAARLQEYMDSGMTLEQAINNMGYHYAKNTGKIYDSNFNPVSLEDITGHGEQYWRNSGYEYKNNSQGRAAILAAFVNAGAELATSAERENFDALFGEGAYNKIKFDMRGELLNGVNKAANKQAVENYLNYTWAPSIREMLPGITDDQIASLALGLYPYIANFFPE